MIIMLSLRLNGFGSILIKDTIVSKRSYPLNTHTHNIGHTIGSSGYRNSLRYTGFFNGDYFYFNVGILFHIGIKIIPQLFKQACFRVPAAHFQTGPGIIA